MEDKKEDVVSIEMTLPEFYLMVSELRNLVYDKKKCHFVNRMIYLENMFSKKYGVDSNQHEFLSLSRNSQEEHTRKFIALTIKHPKRSPLADTYKEILDVVDDKVKEIQREITDRENGYGGESTNTTRNIKCTRAR